MGSWGSAGGGPERSPGFGVLRGENGGLRGRADPDLVRRARRYGRHLGPAGTSGAAGMEQPRYRGDPPGDGEGGGRSAEDSAAWNGSCGRPPVTVLEDNDDDHDLPFPSTEGPRCSCRCRGEPAAPPNPTTERRDGSCSLTCRNRAAAGPVLPPARGQEDGEEDEAGEDGAGKGSRRMRRRQRHRSTPKEKEDGRRREGGAGKRHRPARKRSRGDGTEAPAEEPAGYWGPLAAALAQARRLGAEAGGWLLCSCCRLSGHDLGSAQAGIQNWGRRVGQRARSGSLRVARWLRASTGFFLRLLWMLCALLILLLVLLLGSLRLCWRVGTGALVAGADRLGRSQRVARFLALLDAAVFRRTWGLLGESRTCRHLWDWLQRRRAPPWAPGGGQTGGPGDAASVGDGGASATGCAEEVSRLLAMAEVPEEELNPFQVLGVEATASDAELKKAYRRLAVLVRGRAGGVRPPPATPRHGTG